MTEAALVLFWVSAAGVFYAYPGYPLLLAILPERRPGGRPQGVGLPTISMIVPVHNEIRTIKEKLANIDALDYPGASLEVLFVSDASTDGTPEAIRQHGSARVSVIELPERGGKAAALNAALARIRNEIVVFSDASIMLAPDALRQIVEPFKSPEIGCVSGEDRIGGSSGEGLYGRYELFLRRQESRVGSIVGASGSFYAMRRSLCEPFPANLAPDFWSVLRCVERGSRAVSTPLAIGSMTHVGGAGDEFERKVRTFLRGMTALGEYRRLLNPLRYGLFALHLFSHKLMRWLVPIFLLLLLASTIVLARYSRFFAVLSLLQVGFYAWGIAASIGVLPRRWLVSKVTLYFVTVNAAIVKAWLKYVSGVRQEIWAPSQR